jgi:hypothetical protein
MAYSSFKFPVARAAFGASLAALLAAACGGPPTTSDMDRELSKTRAGQVMKTRFSADYQVALTNLTALAGNTTMSDMERSMAAARESSAIRTKHAKNVVNAPVDSLNKVLRTQADLLKAVESNHGAAACSRFANLGVAELPRNVDSLRDPIDLAGEATMNAIADGRDNPVARVAASQEDMEVLLQALAAKGFDDAAFMAIGNGTPDENDCAYLSTMVSAAIDLPGESGDRVRAALVEGIVSTP